VLWVTALTSQAQSDFLPMRVACMDCDLLLVGSQLMAVSGPIARSISDIAISLAAMAAPDPRDPWYVPASLAKQDFPKRAALTVAPDGMQVVDDVRAALADAADKLRAAGWTVDEVECPPMRPAAEINAHLWMAETQFGAKDLIREEADPDAQLVFEQMSKDVGDIGLDGLMKALQARAGLVREWAVFLQDYPIVICPVSGELPFVQQLDVQSADAFAKVFEAQLTQRALPVIGVPSLSVATGNIRGRPVGVQLIAPHYREDILLAAGRDFEAASGPIQVAEPNWD